VSEFDKDNTNIAAHVFGQSQAESGRLPVQTEGQRDAERDGRPAAKEIKSAAELAQMIEADLASHPHCPKKGFVVTVYGASLWRAMLTITPAAGPVRNPKE